MKKDWTEIMRDKLSESAVTPPDDLWAGISSELDAVVAPQKRHTKPVMIWRWASVAACMAAVVICGIYFYDFNRGTEPQTDVLAQNYQGAETNNHEKVVTNQGVSSQSLGTTSSRKHEVVANASINKVSDDGISIPSANMDASIDTSEDAKVPTEDASIDTSEETNVPAEDASIGASTDAYASIDDIATHHCSPSVSLFASNTNMPNMAGNGDCAASPGDIFVGPPGNVGSTDNDDSDKSETETSRSSDAYKVKDAHHKQPVRFGLSARIPISESFSIGTGITYSMLSSTITMINSKYNTYELDQTLHYIGVPVSIEYNLPSYRSFGFYLTAGAMAEKCIYGRSRVSWSSYTENVTEKGLQLSIFAGAGLQLNLNDHIALYAEPLATYYFDNHSDITNIYKDRPLNIDLRIGLRYTFK